MPGVSTGLLGEGPAAQILGGPALVEINPQGAGGRGLVQMAPASTGGGGAVLLTEVGLGSK